MITLTILKEDGSFYWREYFNTRQEAQKWLAKEKTRPYWEKTYTDEITGEEVIPTPIDPSEFEAIKQKKIADLNKAKDIGELKAFIITNLL